jgi:hypothetical protein
LGARIEQLLAGRFGDELAAPLDEIKRKGVTCRRFACPPQDEFSVEDLVVLSF